jgi:hypothetical protein
VSNPVASVIVGLGTFVCLSKPTLNPMRSRTSLSYLLILTALLLSACTAAATPAAEGPSAADINAAAERAAALATDEAEVNLEAQVVEEERPADPTRSPATETAEPAFPESDDAAKTATEPSPEPDRRVEINPRVEVPADLSVAWLIPWDGIRPIYDPEFAIAAEAPLDDEELVLAISLDGEAKAYPISVLQGREMVNDELAGIPILATW